MPETDYTKDISKRSEQDLMGKSDAKYSVIYHDGLEVVDQDNAPEVVPGSNLHRKSSQHQPEAYHTAPHYSDKPGQYSYYEPPQAIRPSYEGLQPFDSAGSKEAIVTEQQIASRQEQRRCCGIRRKPFIIIVVIVAVIVCIGIILGAALGVLLPKKWAKGSTGLETWSGTGLASTLDGDGSGRLLTYYQDPDGRIVENSYMDGEWTLQNRANIDASVVTTQAAYGSQLAAISYQYGGKTYRQIFFVTSTGTVMTANSTTTNAGMATDWSIARAIATDSVDPTGIGLAACWSHDRINGIHVFYPSQFGYVQEVKWIFGGDKWEKADWLTSSDSQSGMGCAVKDGPQSQYMNVYYRNTASGKVKQAFKIFDGGDVYWSYHTGATSWSNHTIDIGSDIAVCNDDSQTEYVYYQMSGGLVTRGLINPTSIHYESFDNQQGATVGSKLACAFVDAGSMLFFQNRTSSSSIYASDVSRTGVTISNFLVP